MVVARSASEEELVVGGKESWFPMNVVDGIEAMMREDKEGRKGTSKGEEKQRDSKRRNR
jgi:hypothetical protein